jgi:Fur family ferric uptake transcriptional regulator
VGIPSATEFVEKLRPAGGRRSSKRDFIVTVFLRQEGHISADHLVDQVRREDGRISRATIYRTLQWMVEAGIARRVDFGEGRFRFEHSYRHPRHFHLICKTCNQSYEFLSSDIETLIEGRWRGFRRAERAQIQHLRGVPRGPSGASRAGADRSRVRARRAADCGGHRAQRPRVLHPCRTAHA